MWELKDKEGEFKFDPDAWLDVEMRPTTYYENFSYTGEWQTGTENWQGRGICVFNHGAL